MPHCCKNGRFTVSKVRRRRKHCSMLIGCPDQVKHSLNYTPVKSSKTTAHFSIGGRGSFRMNCLLRLDWNATHFIQHNGKHVTLSELIPQIFWQYCSYISWYLSSLLFFRGKRHNLLLNFEIYPKMGTNFDFIIPIIHMVFFFILIS